MKKQFYVITLLALLMTMYGCKKSPSKIEYLPCQEEKGLDWGFVDANGEVFLSDNYKNLPTAVIDGVFFVREGKDDYYTMYKFDKKKPVVLRENIEHFGEPVEGILPICQTDSRIEIIDVSGKKLFELDKIEGLEITSCEPRYKDGLLKVCVIDNAGDRYYALIDKVGKVVLKPKYSDIEIISKDLFFVTERKDGDEKRMFVNRKGEKNDDIKTMDDIVIISDEYFAASRDERLYIFSISGKEIMKCPEKVEEIEQIAGKRFVYHGSDGYGVMDFDGESIVSSKYMKLMILDDGRFLAKRDYNRDWEVLDNKGESIKNLSDFDAVFSIPSTSWLIAEESNHYVFLDSKFKPINKKEYYDINVRGCSSSIDNEYFDYATIVGAVKSLLTEGLETKQLYIGNNLSSINDITSKDADNFNRYSTIVSQTIVKGNKYTVNVKANFDAYVVKPVYREKTVRKYDYWYGYYNAKEKVIDHYEFNGGAAIESIEIECDVPYSKDDNMSKELAAMLKGFADSNDGDSYSKDGYLYKLDGTSIVIRKNLNTSEYEDEAEIENEVEDIDELDI